MTREDKVLFTLTGVAALLCLAAWVMTFVFAYIAIFEPGVSREADAAVLTWVLAMLLTLPAATLIAVSLDGPSS